MKKNMLKKLLATTFVLTSLLNVPSVVTYAENVNQESERVDLRFEYVLESELTANEKASIVKHLSFQKATENATYYMVYRPTVESLPKTGTNDEMMLSTLFGASLLVFAVYVSKKNKKHKVIGMFVISLVGGSLLATNVSAIQNVKFADYTRTISVSKGDKIPNYILDIDGHQFVGYIVKDYIPVNVPLKTINSSNENEKDSTLSKMVKTTKTEETTTEITDSTTTTQSTITKPTETTIQSETSNIKVDELPEKSKPEIVTTTSLTDIKSDEQFTSTTAGITTIVQPTQTSTTKVDELPETTIDSITTTQTKPTEIMTTTMKIETTTKLTSQMISEAKMLKLYHQNGQWYSDKIYGRYSLGNTGCVPTACYYSFVQLFSFLSKHLCQSTY